MKYKLMVSLVAALLLAADVASWAADDGAALYQTKCSKCHGPNGEGKPAMKAPAFKDTTMDATQVADLLTKGDAKHRAPHKKGISGLKENQTKAVADYVKTLK